MAEKKDSENYDVGYKKPPEKSQFKKGESGNPEGRPKMADPPFSTARGERELFSIPSPEAERRSSPPNVAVGAASESS